MEEHYLKQLDNEKTDETTFDNSSNGNNLYEDNDIDVFDLLEREKNRIKKEKRTSKKSPVSTKKSTEAVERCERYMEQLKQAIDACENGEKTKMRK